MAEERAGGAGDWHWHEQLQGAYEGFKADGNDDGEARRRAQWDTRHWWSDSDSHALDRLHPWLPPHLREQGESL